MPVISIFANIIPTIAAIVPIISLKFSFGCCYWFNKNKLFQPVTISCLKEEKDSWPEI